MLVGKSPTGFQYLGPFDSPGPATDFRDRTKRVERGVNVAPGPALP